MMVGNGSPSLTGRTKNMISHLDIPGIYGKPAVQGDTHRHLLAAEKGGNAVAVPLDVDVAVPVDHPLLPVGGVVPCRRKGPQRRGLPEEPLGHHLLDRPVDPLVRLFLQPLLSKQVHVLEAVEAPVPDEEVPLDVPHHPLVLALGPGPVRAAGPGREPVVTGKIEEPLVEVHGITDMVVDHEALLVVHQDLPGDTAEVLEGPDDPLIGVLGILLLCAPEMKPPRISKGVHREVNLPGAAAHLDRHSTPVVLHLMAWLGLVTHRCLALPQGPLRMDIVPHNRIASCVSPLPAFHQDHLGIPDTLPQELVDERFELVELALVRPRPNPWWGATPRDRAAYGPWMQDRKSVV